MSAGALRLGSAVVAVGVTLLLTLAFGGSASRAAGSCSNEARRVEQNAQFLPDCRAYELVSGPALLGQDREPARAAMDGDAVTYYTNHPSPDATTSSYFYLARRSESGWSLLSVGPQNAAAAQFGGSCEQNVFFSPDLTRNILELGWFEPEEPSHCKRPEEEIVPSEPAFYRNVLVHDIAADTNQLVNVTPAGTTPGNAVFDDASDDFRRIVFGEAAALTPDAPAASYNTYVWSASGVHLLTYLPDGAPTVGEIVEAPTHSSPLGRVFGSGFAPLTGATSSDGSRVLFYAGSNLYLRENPDQPQSAVIGGHCTEPVRACTVQVDASQGPGSGGGGVFWRATADGSAVYFTDTSRLTPDSTAETDKSDLYRYDVDAEELTDLTPHTGEAADVRGVSGMAEDGSYFYFVANGALAPGAASGTCHDEFEHPGSCNLYVLHGGAISFIGRLSERDNSVWQDSIGTFPPRQKVGGLGANVSPSGRYLAFLSYASLTGYDNYDAKSQEFDRELFLYDAAAGGGNLACISCVEGPAEEPFLQFSTAGEYGPAPGQEASWMTNSVLDDGTVFFDTAQNLVTDDTNAAEDVYAYRAGELHLLTPGNFAGRAHFLDASPDGGDVFVQTPQALVEADKDNENVSLYGVRVDGGFAEPPIPPPCEGESCRPPTTPPPDFSLPKATSPVPIPRHSCPRRQRRHHRCRCSSQHRRCHRHRHRKHRHHPHLKVVK